MMEKITTGLKICPKCRHLMVIKEGKMTCPKCDREKLEEELKTATKKVGEGIIRRPLKKKKEITYSDPFELCSKVYIMMHAKYEKAPYRRAEVVDFPSDTPIEEIDQKCKEWTKDGVGNWVLLCLA